MKNQVIYSSPYFFLLYFTQNYVNFLYIFFIFGFLPLLLWGDNFFFFCLIKVPFLYWIKVIFKLTDFSSPLAPKKFVTFKLFLFFNLMKHALRATPITTIGPKNCKIRYENCFVFLSIFIWTEKSFQQERNEKLSLIFNQIYKIHLSVRRRE